ncbi:tRNA pseudouridine(38-40) synthase TruA [Anaerostipes sp. 992a]|uniref:tRNA pseudouridine(38-40) synthase TruA n=1 Tax=Anaerostipes sp. 992a TaxID=1261637 RepID=UPI000951F8AC|nr:tRNA pseudouridine(38-40) synthase TruA [Anaerostipes sp. 992a]OLR62966.1 tRNA pseudouridine(38-40) synthase TruA [Anaerostipes sp. 992a]
MKRFKLVVAYDGTHYCGWQSQPNGVTVEGVLNQKLRELLKEDIQVIGASRTDSGVHALGNVAVFDSETTIPGEKLSYALNQRLPKDIVVQHSCQVADDFHPRHCDSRKTYEYQIYNAQFENPLYSRYSHFVFIPLRIEAMQKAAEIIKGEHDFKSFCSSRGQQLTTVRTVYDLDVTKEGSMVKIRVSGNGFLYNMVRIIVGTLIKVGLGVYPPEYVQEILDAKDRTKAGPKVPAKGLKLIGIEYL